MNMPYLFAAAAALQHSPDTIPLWVPLLAAGIGVGLVAILMLWTDHETTK
jgi:hypothetical protein